MLPRQNELQCDGEEDEVEEGEADGEDDREADDEDGPRRRGGARKYVKESDLSVYPIIFYCIPLYTPFKKYPYTCKCTFVHPLYMYLHHIYIHLTYI
jgi:hypothetical protein